MNTAVLNEMELLLLSIVGVPARHILHGGVREDRVQRHVTDDAGRAAIHHVRAAPAPAHLPRHVCVLLKILLCHGPQVDPRTNNFASFQCQTSRTQRTSKRYQYAVTTLKSFVISLIAKVTLISSFSTTSSHRVS